MGFALSTLFTSKLFSNSAGQSISVFDSKCIHFMKSEYSQAYKSKSQNVYDFPAAILKEEYGNILD
jgi:hypothetical protein